MTDREKLVAILDTVNVRMIHRWLWHGWADEIADYLISKGVTV